MDGFKKRLNESVRLKLSFSLSLAILVVALIAGVLSFASAFDEAHELQDDTLRQIAALFNQQHPPQTHLGDAGRGADTDEEARVIVQYLNKQGPDKGDQGVSLPLPEHLTDGLHTLDVNGEPYRVLVKTLDHDLRVVVAQETGIRDEIARDSALRTLTPFLILVPILLLIVADLIHKMFRPITLLSTEVDQRTLPELHPVNEARLPIEVRPFAVAINRLLGRVDQAMDSQRRFVADAAHELRSPLTAMSLQAERLAEADMSDAARFRLNTLRQGIERGRSLLDQLLTLAKIQAAGKERPSPISIHEIFRQVLEVLWPLADAKAIDLGVEGSDDYAVVAYALDLFTLTKNLVDNAIRYTPAGGKVDLSLSCDGNNLHIRVRDNGPGIDLHERERVFDPFYRTLGSDQPGSGLGLSIVKAVAQRLNATVQLDFGDTLAKTGLCVSVAIPIARTRNL